MRARRVSILLAIVAISALTLFILSLADSEAGAAGLPGPLPALPDTLAGYTQTMTIGPDGNARVEIAVVLAQGGYGDLLLPFEFEDATEFMLLSGPAFLAAEPTTMVLGRRMLDLRLEPGATAGDTVRVSALAPFWYDAESSAGPYGVHTLSRRYANVSRFVLRDVRIVTLLPPGQEVHRIVRAVPAFEPKQNPQPPFSVGRQGELVSVSITKPLLAPTGEVRLDLEIRNARRGAIPLIGGLVLACLYLVFFRDVLKPTEKE